MSSFFFFFIFVTLTVGVGLGEPNSLPTRPIRTLVGYIKELRRKGESYMYIRLRVAKGSGGEKYLLMRTHMLLLSGEEE